LIVGEPPVAVVANMGMDTEAAVALLVEEEEEVWEGMVEVEG
jgi:hypothetical protein